MDTSKFNAQGIAALKAVFKVFNIEDATVDGHSGLMTPAMEQEDHQLFIAELLYVQLKLSQAILGIYISYENKGNQEFVLAKRFHDVLITNADNALKSFMDGFANGSLHMKMAPEE